MTNVIRDGKVAMLVNLARYRMMWAKKEEEDGTTNINRHQVDESKSGEAGRTHPGIWH